MSYWDDLITEHKERQRKADNEYLVGIGFVFLSFAITFAVIFLIIL